MRSPLTIMIEQLGGVSPDPATDEAAVRAVLNAVERGVLDGQGAREVLEMLGLAPLSASVPFRAPQNTNPRPSGPQRINQEP